MRLNSYKLLLSALVVSNAIIAQPDLDSLHAAWHDYTRSDSDRVAAYRGYVWNGFLYSQPDSAFLLAQDLIDYGLNKDYPNAEATGYNLQGLSWINRGNYSKALDYYSQSLKIAESINDRSRIAISLNNIGNLHMNLGNTVEALDCYTRSLAICEEIGSQKGIAYSFNNIGRVYHLEGDTIKALDYFNKSLAIKEVDDDQSGIAHSLSNIGSIAMEQGEYAKAIDYFSRSVRIFEQLGNQLNVSNSLSEVGMTYLEIGDYSKAHDYCKRGYELAVEVGSLTGQEYGCSCLYDIYKAVGNDKKALEYFEKLDMIEDSLGAEETNRRLQQMKYAEQFLADSLQTEEAKIKVRMAHQLEVAKKEKTRNWAIAGGGTLLLLAIGLFSRVRYVRKAKARVEKEKDRSENLLLNILPAEIAEELKEKGEAAARDFDMVSILFTDFKGFTQASEKLSAADLVAEINTCFKAFDGIVGKYNIEKIKTIGDAYMCAGGLPVPDENAVTNTVHAGLEMQAFMIARKAERDAAGLPAFEMRVGIHTGPVVAGIVGVKKFQYDIWGDTVNTASRMESSGEVGQVNISEATYELVKDNSAFGFTSRGKVAAKGKGEMEMYFVDPK